MFFKCVKQKTEIIIIDWPSAVDQCGGDETFLKVLLLETHKEITKSSNDLDKYSDNFIREYAHMVKGVSQNLFCKDLQKYSSELEFIIIRDNEDKKELRKHIKKLQKSILRFEKHLEIKGILQTPSTR